jgi:hypothetical protein
MILGTGCNSVDWIHLALERQVPAVDYFEHANDPNVIYIFRAIDMLAYYRTNICTSVYESNCTAQ